jgi:hypothetical protein
MKVILWIIGGAMVGYGAVASFVYLCPPLPF